MNTKNAPSTRLGGKRVTRAAGILAAAIAIAGIAALLAWGKPAFERHRVRKEARAWMEERQRRGAGEAGSRPGEIVNSVEMRLVPIPAGEFLMGSPETEPGRMEGESRRAVRIPRPFYLGATEVTQAQWQAVVGRRPRGFQGFDLPVTHVSRDDVLEFCRVLSGWEGRRYRLPTEEEWEYSCRAGTDGPFAFAPARQAADAGRILPDPGDGERRLEDMAWYGGNSKSLPHPVGELAPNAWGLFDMHGNVWELSETAMSPAPPAGGVKYVMRGGAWYSHPDFCRSALRVGTGKTIRYDMGFRVAMETGSHGNNPNRTH